LPVKGKRDTNFFSTYSLTIPKNLEFSKIPKIFGEISLVLKFLEFWKIRGFFGILENSKKIQVFFGILVENLKKTLCFFLEFAIKF